MVEAGKGAENEEGEEEQQKHDAVRILIVVRNAGVLLAARTLDQLVLQVVVHEAVGAVVAGVVDVLGGRCDHAGGQRVRMAQFVGDRLPTRFDRLRVGRLAVTVLVEFDGQEVAVVHLEHGGRRKILLVQQINRSSSFSGRRVVRRRRLLIGAALHFWGHS